ncbi:MAG: D-aminoacyl-tRNA deacylase, partial [Longimicrobiales bacterium]
MRVVLQRVSEASVSVHGEVVGEIGLGHVLLVGFGEEDEGEEGGEALEWMAEKVVGLRVFADDEGRMNLGLEEVEGELLVVSQFTLYGDTRKGRRPS